MSIAETPSGDRAGGGSAPRRQGAFACWMRRIVGAVAIIGIAAMVAGAIGFGWFVSSVPTDEVVLDRNADGIVVLTGGSARIADALELLAAGRGQRLLITGVYRATTAREIARLTPPYQRLFSKRVDLDHSAVNTVGNAVEARRWVQKWGFRSLIVVTSNYHMPRTMAELAQQLPDVTLIAYPVVTDKVRPERWWSSPPTARLLLFEYLKYIYAQVRMRFEPAVAAAAMTDDRNLATR